MKSRTDKPSVPEVVMRKISQLTELLDEARDLYDDIFEWYDTELKKYDRNADDSSELLIPETDMLWNGYHTIISWKASQPFRRKMKPSLMNHMISLFC